MKKLVFLFMIVVVWTSFGHAQTTITISKHVGGIRYYVEGRRITPRDAFKRLKVNPEASRIFRSGRPRRALASLLAVTGGFTVGLHIARSTASKQAFRRKANWSHMAIGAGLVGASIPLYKSYTKRAEKAIILHNEGLPYSAYSRYRPVVSLSVHGHGAGIHFSF